MRLFSYLQQSQAKHRANNCEEVTPTAHKFIEIAHVASRLIYINFDSIFIFSAACDIKSNHYFMYIYFSPFVAQQSRLKN